MANIVVHRSRRAVDAEAQVFPADVHERLKVVRFEECAIALQRAIHVQCANSSQHLHDDLVPHHGFAAAADSPVAHIQFGTLVNEAKQPFVRKGIVEFRWVGHKRERAVAAALIAHVCRKYEDPPWPRGLAPFPLDNPFRFQV